MSPNYLSHLLLSYLNEYFIKRYKRNCFFNLRKMKIVKPIAFVPFDEVLIEIERAKARASEVF